MVNTFVSSVFSFTSPVRQFKENDPYYFKVDNIPIGQLNENDLWLRDQILNLKIGVDVNRSQFTELRPSVNGGDRVLRVAPGNYISRINDLHAVTPLEKLELLIGKDPNEYGVGLTDSVVQGILDRIIDNLAAPLFLNGLTERIFRYPTVGEDQAAGTVVTDNQPKTNVLNFPSIWPLKTTTSFYKSFVAKLSYSNLPLLESQLIKQFRGVARTAVVDLPTEVSVPIEDFADGDFFYIDSNGTKVNITGAQTRIDLVFIYSKPVDVTGVTINKWSGGQPQRINTPILGVVKGAGLGIVSSTGLNFTNLGQGTLTNLPVGVDSEDGTGTGEHSTEDGGKILPHVPDQNSINGFSALNVHGSFPAPDDLMNLAPNIIENLESDDFQLIGQTVMPVCYVVVKKNQSTIESADIIDIRPFFRTAELTYSERAGLAAANPGLSLVNPAVGEFQLEQKVLEIQKNVIASIPEEVLTPRPVGGGIIYGGRFWGPEGAIDNIEAGGGIGVDGQSPLDVTDSLFPDVPLDPDWDLARWITNFNIPPATEDPPGMNRNDRINIYSESEQFGKFFAGKGQPATAGGLFDGGAFGNRKLGIGTVNFLDLPVCLLWCQKEIAIDRTAVPWMVDYTVEAQFENCIAISHKGVGLNVDQNAAAAVGLWVSRFPDKFIIYCAWAGDDTFNFGQKKKVHGLEPKDQRKGHWFSGFAARYEAGNFFDPPATEKNAMTGEGPKTNPRIGACTYPTVTFKVTGYPAGFFSKTLPAGTPTLVLK